MFWKIMYGNLASDVSPSSGLQRHPHCPKQPMLLESCDPIAHTHTHTQQDHVFVCMCES